MKKFCVFSGFLGAGKTTTMMALTKYYSAHYGKAAMISNDLGHGVNLADHRLAKLSGCNATEITDDCICYKHEELSERLNTCYAEGCELVISDIPGFGVGALEHVYHGLTEKYQGAYELAPFTVIVEPNTVDLLRAGRGGDMEYILRMQLEEADLIVLNKCDTIDQDQAEDCKTWLKENYPYAEVLCISAFTGNGLDALSHALKNGSASMRRISVDYSDAAFVGAMDKLSEYYIQYHASVCCNTFDGSAYLTDMANSMQKKLQASAADVPHLKLLAWSPNGDYGKVDLIGVDRPVVETKGFEYPCTDIAVILNASAICSSYLFEKLMKETVEAVSEQYQLEIMIFKKESFGFSG